MFSDRTKINISIAAAISAVATVIGLTWYLANAWYDINYRLAAIETLRDEQSPDPKNPFVSFVRKMNLLEKDYREDCRIGIQEPKYLQDHRVERIDTDYDSVVIATATSRGSDTIVNSPKNHGTIIIEVFIDDQLCGRSMERYADKGGSEQYVNVTCIQHISGGASHSIVVHSNKDGVLSASNATGHYIVLGGASKGCRK